MLYTADLKRTYKVFTNHYKIYFSMKRYIIVNSTKKKSYDGHKTFCHLVFEKVLIINLLNTKLRLLYLKNQFLPRSKHFSSRL